MGVFVSNHSTTTESCVNHFISVSIITKRSTLQDGAIFQIEQNDNCETDFLYFYNIQLEKINPNF